MVHKPVRLGRGRRSCAGLGSATCPSVAALPLLILLVSDFVQYWTHRAYHEVPLLWRLHAVHHSAKQHGLAGRLTPAHPGDC